MSPQPFVNQHDADCICPPCSAQRNQPAPQMSWKPIRRAFLFSVPIGVAAAILGLLIVHAAQAREGRQLAPTPRVVAKARQACPINKPLKCRAALVHAYEAIAWAKHLRTHRRREVPLARVSSWSCIHQHEGAWNDTGDPYWGGLQMDREFMQTYGADMIRKYGGWADRWPPRDQIIVANRAYRTRGFNPWPNTARACGLLP